MIRLGTCRLYLWATTVRAVYLVFDGSSDAGFAVVHSDVFCIKCILCTVQHIVITACDIRNVVQVCIRCWKL